MKFKIKCEGGGKEWWKGEVMSTFSRKNEITIPSLQYRKAKELTVRLNGLVKTLLLEGIDTLGLLLLLRNRSGINSCYAFSKIQSKTTFILSIY